MSADIEVGEPTTAVKQPPTRYALEVCRYCGQQAKWPGCEHWQTHEGWTLVISVVTTEKDRDRLRVAMNAGAES